MNRPLASARKHPEFAALALLVLMAGCVLDTVGDPQAGPAEPGEQIVATFELDPTTPDLADDAEAEGLILAPDELVVYVGDELLVELELLDPTLGVIRPADLPFGADFAADASGALVSWMPELEDVGQHDFVFLVVDADEENLVLGAASIIVSVLPRFGLIEYGF